MAVSIIGKLLFCGLKNIKIDEFHPASIIFVIESSSTKQLETSKEIQYLRNLCSTLDPEDTIKIINASDSAYLIYEGSPSDASTINDTLNKFARNNKNYNTAYSQAIKKAFEHALTMKKEDYVPSIVVIGDLESNGNASKDINWDVLPKNVEKVKQYIPEISMMFVYAHPEKLDMVKSKLNPVLGEKKLIIVNEQAVNKSQRRLLEAIGR